MIEKSILAIKAKDVRGRLRWEGSKAQILLDIDIDNDKHLEPSTDTPTKLWMSRIEYRLFELEVFRKHLDQAKQARKEFGKTPGQHKSNHRKVGGKKYRRTEEEEEESLQHSTIGP